MEKPIRVLEFRCADGPGGGPEKTILLGAANADPQRVAVTVCYIRELADPNTEIRSRAAKLNVDYVEIRQRHRFDPSIVKAARQLVEKKAIHIIHAHDYKTNVLAICLARTAGVIPMSTAHGWTGHLLRERLVYYPLDKRILRHFPFVFTVSSQIRDELLRAGARRTRVHTLLNGIDPAAFRHEDRRRTNARTELGFSPSDVVLGSVGRLEPQKRFDLLLQAYSRLRVKQTNLRLILAGEGSSRAGLEQEAERLGLGANCRLLGHCSNIGDFYHALDVFVQSSDYEGTPNVVLEAMAFEIPIVATDAGGTAELVENRVHGLVVPKGSVDALCGAIDETLKMPEATRARVLRARQRVERELSFAERQRTVERAYARLVADFGRGRRGPKQCPQSQNR